MGYLIVLGNSESVLIIINCVSRVKPLTVILNEINFCPGNAEACKGSLYMVVLTDQVFFKRAQDTITDGCEPLFDYWELKSGLLEEQEMLLTSESSQITHGEYR